MLASLVHRRSLMALLIAFILTTTPASADEVDYLPNGTFILYSLDVAAGMKSKLYKEMTTKIKDFERGLGEMHGQIGIEPKNISRLLAGAASFGHPEENMIVVTTIKPVTAADIKAAKKPFPFFKNYKITESKIGKYSVYEESYTFDFGFDPKDKDGQDAKIQKGQVFCVAEENVVLFSRMESMKKILEGNRKPKFSSGVAAGLKEVGLKASLTVLLDLEAMPERERKEAARGLAREIPGAAEAFETFKFLTLQGNAPDKVSLVGTLACKDADSAANAVKLAKIGLGNIKEKIKKFDPNIPKSDQELLVELGKLIDSIKLSSVGAQARGEFQVEARTAIAMVALTGRPNAGTPPVIEFKKFDDEKK